MFETPLHVSIRDPKPKTAKKEKPLPTAQELNITYNRNDRDDIDCKGYKSYFFHFTQTGDVGDKEMEQIIISRSTMEEAIATFEKTFFRGDYYKNSVLNVERTGIDLKPDREDPIVVAY